MNYSRRTCGEKHAAFSVAARTKWIIIKYVEHISSICNEGAGKSTGVLSDRAQTTCTGTIAIQHQQSHCVLKQEQVRLQQSSWTWLLFASKLSQQIQRHIYSRKSNNPPFIYRLNRFYSIYFIFRPTKSAHSTLNDTWADTQTHHVPQKGRGRSATRTSFSFK